MQVVLVIRDVGKSKPDYSLPFELPEIPRVGDYISVQRPDDVGAYGEDLIVRYVWWRLKYPSSDGYETELVPVGDLEEIFVECDPATSVWSRKQWKKSLEGARSRGVEVPHFDVARIDIGEENLR